MSNYSNLLKRAALNDKLESAYTHYERPVDTHGRPSFNFEDETVYHPGVVNVKAPMDPVEAHRNSLRRKYKDLRNKELCNYFGTLAGVTGARLGMSWARPGVSAVSRWFGKSGNDFADRLNKGAKDRSWGDWLLQTGVDAVGGGLGALGGYYGAKGIGKYSNNLGNFWSDMSGALGGYGDTDVAFDEIFKGMSNEEVRNRLHGLNKYINRKYSPSNSILSVLAGASAATGAANAYDYLHGDKPRSWGDYLLRQGSQIGASIAGVNMALGARSKILGTNKNPLPYQYYDPTNPKDMTLGKQVGRFINDWVAPGIPAWYVAHGNYKALPAHLRGDANTPEAVREWDNQIARKNMHNLDNYRNLQLLGRGVERRVLNPIKRKVIEPYAPYINEAYRYA